MQTIANTCRDDHHIVEIYRRCHPDRNAEFVPGYAKQSHTAQ